MSNTTTENAPAERVCIKCRHNFDVGLHGICTTRDCFCRCILVPAPAATPVARQHEYDPRRVETGICQFRVNGEVRGLRWDAAVHQVASEFSVGFAEAQHTFAPAEVHIHDFKQIEGQSSLECECGAVPDYESAPPDQHVAPSRIFIAPIGLKVRSNATIYTAEQSESTDIEYLAAAPIQAALERLQSGATEIPAGSGHYRRIIAANDRVEVNKSAYDALVKAVKGEK